MQLIPEREKRARDYLRRVKEQRKEAADRRWENTKAAFWLVFCGLTMTAMVINLWR